MRKIRGSEGGRRRPLKILLDKMRFAAIVRVWLAEHSPIGLSCLLIPAHIYRLLNYLQRITPLLGALPLNRSSAQSTRRSSASEALVSRHADGFFSRFSIYQNGHLNNQSPNRNCASQLVAPPLGRPACTGDWKSVIYKLLTDLAIKKRFRAAGNARGEPSSLGEQSACADLRRAARDTFYNSKAASRGH